MTFVGLPNTLRIISWSIVTLTPPYAVESEVVPDDVLVTIGVRSGAGSPDWAFAGAVSVMRILPLSPALTTNVVVAGSVAFQPRIFVVSNTKLKVS